MPSGSVLCQRQEEKKTQTKTMIAFGWCERTARREERKTVVLVVVGVNAILEGMIREGAFKLRPER